MLSPHRHRGPGSSRRAKDRRPRRIATATISRTTPATSSITCLTVPCGCGTRPSSSLPGPIVSTMPPTKVTLKPPIVNCVTRQTVLSSRRDVQRRPDRAGVERVREAHRDRHTNPPQHRLPSPSTAIESSLPILGRAQPHRRATVWPAPARPLLPGVSFREAIARFCNHEQAVKPAAGPGRLSTAALRLRPTGAAATASRPVGRQTRSATTVEAAPHSHARGRGRKASRTPRIRAARRSGWRSPCGAVSTGVGSLKHRTEVDGDVQRCNDWRGPHPTSDDGTGRPRRCLTPAA